MPGQSYRALAGYASGSTTNAGTGRTLGLEFSVAEHSWLTTVWFYRPTTTTPLPTAAGCWTVNSASSGTLVAGSTAVTWAATSGQTGWIPGVLAAPVLLAPGVTFRAGVLASDTVPGQANYWTTGAGKDGLSSGPLRVPSAASAVGQGVYAAGGALAFPTTVTGANYGIDVTVEPDPDLIQGENLHPNPAAAVDGTGWLAYSSATAVTSRVTNLTGMTRSTGYRVTRNDSVGDIGMFGTVVPVVPGDVVTFSVEMKASVASADTRLYLFPYDSAGKALPFHSPPALALQANTPARARFVFTIPAGVATVRPLPFINGAAAGCVLEVTALRARRGSWPNLGYFDGDSPKWTWDGTPGASTSRRNPKVWAADTDSSDAATVGTAIGYTGTQFQMGADPIQNNYTPIPVQAAPGARPGRATKVTLPAGAQRYEHNPDHRTFVHGDRYFFGFSFYLDTDFPLAFPDFQVIEQLHGAPPTGSPVLAFEVRDGGQLRLTGGANRPGASSPGQYAYDRVLRTGVERLRWYAVVYEVEFSRAPGGGYISVWVDGVQCLDRFPPSCGTVYDTDISSLGGGSYRKAGLYRRPTV